MSLNPEATQALSVPIPPFEYPPSLQKYMVSKKDFCRQNPQNHVLVTGIVVFNNEGKLLLVQRAADEKAFPDLWEIPGGKVEEPDETLLHAAVRELKEETGLTATRIVRKVGEFGWSKASKNTDSASNWLKHIFEIEVENLENVVLDPVEHQRYLWVEEQEIELERIGDVELKWISMDNKDIKLEAFRKRRDGVE